MSSQSYIFLCSFSKLESKSEGFTRIYDLLLVTAEQDFYKDWLYVSIHGLFPLRVNLTQSAFSSLSCLHIFAFKNVFIFLSPPFSVVFFKLNAEVCLPLFICFLQRAACVISGLELYECVMRPATLGAAGLRVEPKQSLLD